MLTTRLLGLLLSLSVSVCDVRADEDLVFERAGISQKHAASTFYIGDAEEIWEEKQTDELEEALDQLNQADRTFLEKYVELFPVDAGEQGCWGVGHLGRHVRLKVGGLWNGGQATLQIKYNCVINHDLRWYERDLVFKVSWSHPVWLASKRYELYVVPAGEIVRYFQDQLISTIENELEKIEAKKAPLTSADHSDFAKLLQRSFEIYADETGRIRDGNLEDLTNDMLELGDFEQYTLQARMNFNSVMNAAKESENNFRTVVRRA